MSQEKVNSTYTESQPRESYEVDYSAVTEYLQGA